MYQGFRWKGHPAGQGRISRGSFWEKGVNGGILGLKYERVDWLPLEGVMY
jgi:hypothetical protein